MVFNSLTFLLFFTCVILLHNLPFPWRAKKNILWMASYLFYAAWNPPFVVLLWISTLVDWFAAKAIFRARTSARRRVCLVVSLVVNLGLLGYFKYGGFILENVISFMVSLGVAFHPAAPDIVLPVGISFYTFQSMSYSIDIYRGRMRPWEVFSDFALYVTFFPQLVAGPIVRAADFLPQCLSPRKADGRQMGWGLSLLTLGLFQKVILADTMLAPLVDTVYAQPSAAGFLDAWAANAAFAGQIFFDFSGYSTCAIGAALCLGFVLPDNFRFPYASVGFSDFWRRWHISLSSWLRDYLYIPLGGNRKGTLMAYRNLVITMLLGGLWHGASWMFVIWGGLHGIYLAVERFLRQHLARRLFFQRREVHMAMWLLTVATVCVTWTFFRSRQLSGAFALIAAMAGSRSGNLLSNAEIATVATITALLVWSHWRLRHSSLEALAGRLNWPVRAVVLAALLICLALTPGDDRAFIYFQF